VQCLVIIPTYNERENLPAIVPRILEQGDHFQVLVVDDNSPDGTGELAEDLARRHPGRVHVEHRAGKRGLGTAYIHGFGWGLARGYDFIYEMDADFSHDPNDLPRLLAAAQRADVAIGSRWVRGGGTRNWSLLRQLISRGGSAYAQLILGIPVRDLTAGFKCFRRRVLASLDLGAIRSNGYAFQVEMNYACYKSGFRIAEVPVIFVDRRVGQSKMSSGIVLEAMLRVWKWRLSGPAGVRRGRGSRVANAESEEAEPRPPLPPSPSGRGSG
jgi:dolichol-phosphate mannosyltransferase